MNCLKSMSVAMIFSTILKIFIAAVFPQGTSLMNINYFAIIMIALSYFILKKYSVNPIYVMLGCGTISLLMSFIGLA